jgi:hypothetical protein
MKLEAHPGSKLSNKKKTRTMWRRSHKTAKRNSFPRISRIGVNKAVRTLILKTITETTKVNHNGETITLATTQIATK